jgi:hypothetical protein
VVKVVEFGLGLVFYGWPLVIVAGVLRVAHYRRREYERRLVYLRRVAQRHLEHAALTLEEISALGRPPHKFFMRRQPTLAEAESRSEDEILLARSALLRTKYTVRAASVLLTTTVSVAAGFLFGDVARIAVAYATTPMPGGIFGPPALFTFAQLGRLSIVLFAVFALLSVPASVVASANLSRRVDERIAAYREIIVRRDRRIHTKRQLFHAERSGARKTVFRRATRRA